ncbi:unnamed protein product [Chrysodeixis includens]|uniref:Uncharacterized protein n=1 Tax=Chrysodeixis includens TaxID=689277 RepID=A0A9N8PZQ8_CHRIL|nr:unnamed protein product [Chrysodeixis includens]
MEWVALYDYVNKHEKAVIELQSLKIIKIAAIDISGAGAASYVRGVPSGRCEDEQLELEPTMTVRLFHAVAAILTVLLFYFKQKCALAGVAPEKRRAVEVSECNSETLFTSLLADRLRSAGAGLAACATNPRYKRDPDICLDNEEIGQHPRDRSLIIQ